MNGFDQTSVIGAVLGSYRVTAELSSGGMGSVYRAQHEILGRAAAIKLLRPELAANVDLVQRFFTEAKAASAIHHPGIVEVFDFGYTSDGRAYLIMELLEGQTLARRLHDRGGRLAEHEAAQIARGIASALTAAHGKGIVHRDLKPDNVFLVPDPDMPLGERPKLLDFGIAKLADALSSNTQTGALLGTPLYMAPEQARAAQAIDHRADLYSLGCILYQMLVGQPPFVAAGSGEIIALHLFTPPERPSSRVPVSPEIDAIVMRLLAKEPRERFASAAEVFEALASVAGFVSGRMSTPLSALELARAGPVMHSALPDVMLHDERPVMEPAKRSTMPIVAGIVTLVIAIVAIGFVVAHSSGDADSTPPPAGSADTATGSAAGSSAPGSAGESKSKGTAALPPSTGAPATHVTAPPPAHPTPPAHPIQTHVTPPAHAPPTHVTPPAHATTPPVTHPGSAVGPVVHPDKPSEGPVVHPDKPVTDNLSPIENDVGEPTRKKSN